MMQRRARNSVLPMNRLGPTWAAVEARKALPATIVVTSATATEDTEAIARSLAEAASIAGKRVAFFGLSPGSAGTSDNLSYAEVGLTAAGPQREAVDVALVAWLETFDAVIVDAGPFGAFALAAHLVRVADSVIVGICDKRRVEPADRELARFLQEVGASLLGVVTTAPMKTTARVDAVPDLSRLRPATQQ